VAATEKTMTVVTASAGSSYTFIGVFLHPGLAALMRIKK
jgi:hypothetical protein